MALILTCKVEEIPSNVGPRSLVGELSLNRNDCNWCSPVSSLHGEKKIYITGTKLMAPQVSQHDQCHRNTSNCSFSTLWFKH